MKRSFRLPAVGRATQIVLGLMIGIVLAVALFDANWLRPWLERHLAERSHRKVSIGRLELEQRFSFHPTVRLRDVYIENAQWADTRRPMAVASEASFTFALGTLFDERRVVTKVLVRDAELDLQWRPDGVRNWRLREPDHRGTGRYKVLRVEAHRASVRFARPGIALEVIGVWTPAESGAAAGHGTPVSNRIDFEGRYRDAPFAGTVFASDVLTIQETGQSFPFRGHASSGKTRIDADGTAGDLLKLSAIDAGVRIAGPSLRMRPFIDVVLPSRPYLAEARLKKNGDSYAVERMQAKIGGTDIAGEITYRHEDDDSKENARSMLRANLRSESADLADFGIGGGSAKSEAAPGQALPRSALGAERMRSIDARISLSARKLTAAAVPALESLKLSADLDAGVLNVKSVDLGVAGGRATGALTLDAQREPAYSQVALDMRGLRLERLWPTLGAKGVSSGAVSAQVRLSGRGNSVAAMAGNATGSMSLHMLGGRISNLLDAKLGLNLGKILRLSLAGDQAIGVNCAAIAFDFSNGLGKSRAIVLDTEQTHVEGKGTANLRDETLDVLLDPTQKKPGLLSLPSSIRVHGSLKHPVFELDNHPVARPAADEKHVQCPQT